MRRSYTSQHPFVDPRVTLKAFVSQAGFLCLLLSVSIRARSAADDGDAAVSLVGYGSWPCRSKGSEGGETGASNVDGRCSMVGGYSTGRSQRLGGGDMLGAEVTRVWGAVSTLVI